MRHGRSGRKTDYQWFNIGDIEGGQNLGTAQGVFGTTSFTFSTPGTLTRIRGRVGVVLDAGGVDESAMILAGLCVIQNDQFASGAAPEIFNNTVDDQRWIWQGALYVNSGAEAAVVTEFLSDHIEIDTKAMKRVRPNETLAFVFQSPGELVVDQTGTFDITYFIHALIGT